MKDQTSRIVTLLAPHLGLLLLLLRSLHGSEQTCPHMCLCLSDTISCSSRGLAKPPHSLPSLLISLDLNQNNLSSLGPSSFNKMPRLENLWIAHNQIRTLEHNTFHTVSGLRLLDLSSNQLCVVQQHTFQGLWQLEELRLYNNKITQVEAGALRGLSSLERVYFSLNQLTHFPFFSIQGHSHPLLAVLDLSSNRLARLQWEDVEALPPSLVQRGLFLHNNSLFCDCSMYGLFWSWNLRNYSSVQDFLDEYTCNVNGDPRVSIRFLRHNHSFLSCAVDKVPPAMVLRFAMDVSEGDRVLLDCQTSLGGTNLSFTWLSPNKGLINQTGIKDTLISIFSNGTLEIRAAAVSDSGLYLCTAVDVGKALNATREVNVTVRSHVADPFHTGYTTLLGCVVTLLLILVYLFLTPCRFCSWPTAAYSRGIVSSVFLPSKRGQPRTEAF